MIRSSISVGAVLGLVVLATSCGPAKDSAAPPAAATSAYPLVTDADIKFMQGMIGHHAQAIAMAALVPSHGASERLKQLAQKIDISQRAEIDFMVSWLLDRKQTVPDSTEHQHMMPGMLSPAQIVELDAARGIEFERLFLTFMIQHHTGALTMVDSVRAAPNALQDSDISRFAGDVVNDQQAEIDAMTEMLNALPTRSGS